MSDENLLVGVETSDDAAVYKLNEETALIHTLDFFTPMVDDPYTFGQIAAANSLSDVYAMGGKPITALNIVGFPNCLPIEILGDILRGGADKVKECGAVLVGGHSIQDDEPKYGLSVTGMVSPDKVLKNYGCKVGDLLILTKPLGIGIVTTALKGGVASEDAYDEAVAIMTTLNKYAAEIIFKRDINACTDITGFGLMGHGYEMASASEVTLSIKADAVPFIKEARAYAEMGFIPGGCYNNKKYLKGKYSLNNVDEWKEDIIFDPQTSGGLLISCSRDIGMDLLSELNTLDIKSAIIGEVIEKQDYFIIVE
jgi:selenide,water dikinase